MHQLQSELEALRSLRAEESEAAATDGVLRLPSPEQGLSLSVPEPHVSPQRSRGPAWWQQRVPRQDAALRRRWEDTGGGRS